MSASATVVVCEACGQKNRVPAAATGTPRCGKCHASLPWIAEADSANFGEVVEASPMPVLLDALERLARQHAGHLKLVKANIDEAPDIAQRFAVQGIPTLLILNQGQVVARQTGAPGEQMLEAWLEQALETTA